MSMFLYRRPKAIAFQPRRSRKVYIPLSQKERIMKSKFGAFVATVVSTVFLTLMLVACPKGVVAPKVDADAAATYLDAGGQITGGLCSLIEGITDSGVVRSICATAEEVLSIASFILTLRQEMDAGKPAAALAPCTNLPGTTLCATKQEVAEGILFVTHLRMQRHMLDAGAR